MEARTSIYIIRPTAASLVGTVDTKKLSSLSEHARRQLQRGSTGAGLRPASVTFPEHLLGGTEVAKKALGTVLKWIDGNDIKTPRPLTVEDTGAVEFPDLVYAYKAAYVLHIDKNIRGDHVRDEIIAYVRAAPLRFDEFAMLLEMCDYDTSLSFIVKNHTIEFKLRSGVPEMAKIEVYAQQNGFFEELGRIEKAMKVGMAKQDERNAAGR